MNALVLKLKKNIAQSFDGNGLADLPTAYLVILAEHAFEVAAGEENGTAAFFAAYAGLLAEVSGGSGDARQGGGGAHPGGGIFTSFDAALART